MTHLFCIDYFWGIWEFVYSEVWVGVLEVKFLNLLFKNSQNLLYDIKSKVEITLFYLL